MRDFPQYYGRFGQRNFAFRGRGAHRNHNGLLHRMPGVDGIKTGYTNAAGSNLAASAVRDGRRLVAVVLGRLVFRRPRRACRRPAERRLRRRLAPRPGRDDQHGLHVPELRQHPDGFGGSRLD
jgi:D-alanyl-D-alanine carboxypeptidase